MADKEMVSYWGVHLSRHLQILVASFPERFSPDHIAELKWDHFYGGLPKQLKVMVAYLKAIADEKSYSDYLWAAQEAKEEAMETSQSSATASTSKPKVISFFPLWKLKGSQLTIIPSARVAHLKEKSANEEEGVDGEGPDGIKGMTKEFIIHLARAVKDAQQTEKCHYHCDSPDHFIHDCQQLVEMKADAPLNQKGGTVMRKGGQAPQGKMVMPKVPQDGVPKAWHQTQTPFLNPDPFIQWYRIENVARVRVNGECCMALLDNSVQINTITPGYVENHSLNVRPLSYFVGGWFTCIGLGNAGTWPIGYVII